MVDACLSTGLAAYLAGGFVLLAWMAFLDRHRLREAFWLSLVWPLVTLLLPVAALLAWLERLGWRVNVSRRRADLSPWGVRRPSSGLAGRAVRCPWWELQVWKVHREARRGR